MASIWLCSCQCHASTRADYEAARQLNNWQAAIIASSDPLVNAIIPVDARDPLEAAAACEVCKANHAVALSDAPPPFLPPQDWSPNSDSTGDSD